MREGINLEADVLSLSKNETVSLIAMSGFFKHLRKLKKSDGSVVEITPSRFFDDAVGAAVGVGFDSPNSIFALSRAGARLLKRSPESPIYAVEIPSNIFDEGLLKHLDGLPNLEQLQLSGCRVSDRHLRRLNTFYNLVGIGLNDTDVTEKGLGYLSKHPRLVYIEHRGTQIIKNRNDEPAEKSGPSFP